MTGLATLADSPSSGKETTPTALRGPRPPVVLVLLFACAALLSLWLSSTRVL